jgi:small subunit ribosomal protein S17
MAETTAAAPARASRKVRQGVVVSDRMQKTIVVGLETTVEHPLYKKRMRRTTRIKAHDEENTCRVGDRVEVMETRPVSRDKRWRLVRVIERAK